MHTSVSFPGSHGDISTRRQPTSRPVVALQAFSVLLALCLWMALSSCTPEREAEISLPVRTVGLAEGLVLLAQPPLHIAVTLRGKPSAIDKLLGADQPYTLDLDGVGPGRHQFPVTLERIPLPVGLEVLKAEPTVLEVHVEREMTKTVPVSLSFTGAPPEGYLVSGSEATPAEVTLCGPESVLAPIETILTKAIDLSGRTQSFRQETALELIEGIQTQPEDQSILADVTVAEQSTTRRLEPIPVVGIGSDRAVTVVPKEIQLEVVGPIRSLDKLPQTEGFRVYVDLKGLKPGVYVRRATIELPVGIQLIQAKPKLFTVTISETAGQPEKPPE